MKIQTFSILAGSSACNARCPFCISSQTNPHGIATKETPINWRNFKKACEFANRTDVTTVMITGKGEPTLFPHQITAYLKAMQEYNFPFIEIQTNGIILSEKFNTQINPSYSKTGEDWLKEWYNLGLTTICISNVGCDPVLNHKIYSPHKKEYIDLKDLINKLHEIGFMVRLTTVLIDGGVDSGEKLKELIQYAKDNKVKQLSICPVNKTEEANNHNAEIYNWVSTNFLKQNQLDDIKDFCEKNGVILNYLAHGAVVYDIFNQNVCFRNCLTVDAKSEQLRNLIFFPDGSLRTDWQYGGAVLL